MSDTFTPADLLGWALRTIWNIVSCGFMGMQDVFPVHSGLARCKWQQLNKEIRDKWMLVWQGASAYEYGEAQCQAYTGSLLGYGRCTKSSKTLGMIRSRKYHPRTWTGSSDNYHKRGMGRISSQALTALITNSVTVWQHCCEHSKPIFSYSRYSEYSDVAIVMHVPLTGSLDIP